ncbi:MAG: hypothetical protein AAGA11_07935 [Pseudomonadota bacterium]
MKVQSQNGVTGPARTHLRRVLSTSLALGDTVVGMDCPWDTDDAPRQRFTVEREAELAVLHALEQTVYIEVAPTRASDADGGDGCRELPDTDLPLVVWLETDPEASTSPDPTDTRPWWQRAWYRLWPKRATASGSSD